MHATSFVLAGPLLPLCALWGSDPGPQAQRKAPFPGDHMVCHCFVSYSQVKVCFLLGAVRLLPKCSHLECWPEAQSPAMGAWLLFELLPCVSSSTLRCPDTWSGRFKVQNCRLACWWEGSQLIHLCSLSRLVVEPSTGLGLWGNLQTISVGSARNNAFPFQISFGKAVFIGKQKWGAVILKCF